MRNIILIFILVLVMTFPVSAFAEGFEPGTPRAVTLGLAAGDSQNLNLSWKNDSKLYDYIQNSYPGKGLYYHVNLYARQGIQVYIKEISFSYEQLIAGEGGYVAVSLNPKELGITENGIDLMSTSFSVRVRYIQEMNDILGSYYLADSFSASANLGLIYPYNLASGWAIEELDKALEYGFITNRISSNMREIISREEFSEMMVSLYEARTGEKIEFTDNPFIDTDDPQILKAASLEIIKGYDDGTFKPDNPISRQDIAVIIFRTLKLMIPDMNTSYTPYLGEEEIKDYAYDSVMFLYHHGIMKGDNKGRLNPLDHTTREQAALLTLRAYEEFGN